MKDFLGNELEINDKVVVSLKHPFHQLAIMHVIGFKDDDVMVSSSKDTKLDNCVNYSPKFMIKILNEDKYNER